MVFHFQKMDATFDGDEEDYIDMELSSLASPQTQSREFEFQMSTASNHSQATTSPADELFYKGKLLPLYLPPRRQMVQSLLLLHPTTAAAFESEDNYYSTPSTNTGNTPLDSCNISPSESCRVSCELDDPDDYFFEWSNELNSFINNHPTKITWAKKLKLIKLSILGHHKLRASKAYLKSLFVKSACSHDSSAKLEASEKSPFKTRKPSHPTIATIMNNIEKEGVAVEAFNNNAQRRSFSSAIKRHSPTKCLSSSSSNSNSSSGSSSFSLNSNGLHDQLHCLRRSSSATEIEGAIEAAIAHCKSSHQVSQSGI